MNKFVKRIITHSKKEDKSGKFLKNGLVEIILVKVGILLALAIYGFYLDHVEQKKIEEYFISIHQEIEPAIKKGEEKNKQINTLIVKVTNCLNIINAKNIDSLKYLKDNLGPLVSVNSQTISFPAAKELSNNSYISKVKNKETVNLLRKMQQQLIVINEKHKFNTNRYLLTVEPFTNVFFNYSEIALPKQKEFLIDGGPATDYDKVFNNMVLWNLLSQKLEGYKSHLHRQKEFIILLKALNTNLKNQIDN